MTKDDFLKNLAIKGFDIGFGAKRNFASFDLINKLPSWAGFTSLIIAVLQLIYTNIPHNKEISVIIIFSSIAIIYLEIYKYQVNDFESEGVRLTKIFNRMRDLYLKVKSDDQFDFCKYDLEYNQLLDEFYSKTISKQVFMSNLFGHFKFFYEMQIDWIHEQLNFRFFKDKIPNSLKIFLILLLGIIFTYGYL